MKNLNKILILVVLFFIISTPFVVFSQVANFDSTVSKEYVSLSPLPGTGKVDLDDTSTYFSNLFTIFIVIASTLAVIRLILCGITYMTSESISTKTDAKGCIWGVLAGLFLILLSVIILGQINKDFLRVDFAPIKENISGVVKGGSTDINNDSSAISKKPKTILDCTTRAPYVYTHETIESRIVSCIGANTLEQCELLRRNDLTTGSRTFTNVTACKENVIGEENYTGTKNWYYNIRFSSDPVGTVIGTSGPYYKEQCIEQRNGVGDNIIASSCEQR